MKVIYISLSFYELKSSTLVFFFLYRKGFNFFLDKGPRPLWLAGTATASVEITVNGMHNSLNYSVIVYSLHRKVKVMLILEQVT